MSENTDKSNKKPCKLCLLRDIDRAEYEAKINELKACYKAASAKLKNHLFYIPIKDGDDWQIFRYMDGEEISMTKKQFKLSFNE